jgi:dihydrofolate reductase
MRRIIVLERITVDGIFDAAGMAEWDFPYDSEGRVAVIAGGIQASDAYLLGRTTYEMLAPGWSALKNNEYGVADKLNSMVTYVVSSSPLEFEWGNTTVLRGDAVEEVGKLKRQPGGDILVHGSAKLVESLLAAGLVDELQLLVHPVVMGGGARLFNDTEHTAKLELVEARPVGLDVVLLRYHPAKG